MLSDEKIEELSIGKVWSKNGESLFEFARAIEAAVLTEQAKQEPVAWLIEDSNGDGKAIRAKDIDRATLLRFIAVTRTPLYLHPAPAPEGMAMVPRRSKAND